MMEAIVVNLWIGIAVLSLVVIAVMVLASSSKIMMLHKDSISFSNLEGVVILILCVNVAVTAGLAFFVSWLAS